jgi:cytochrome c-type protein NapB
MDSTTNRSRGPLSPGAQLGLAVVISAAVVGYFVGLTGAREGGPAPWRPLRQETPMGRAVAERGSTAPDAPRDRSPSAQEDAIPATAYWEMRADRTGPNRDWSNTLASLVQPTLDPFSQATQRTEDPARLEQELLATLAARATRRAYNGAPPVVPHRIDQESPANCIACHGPGLMVEDRRASRIPHALLSNCVQCHVEDRGAAPMGTGGAQVAPLLVLNGFRGLPAPLGGERAWIGAPPTVPHSTLMRSDCLSCHGGGGPLGMRSAHPWRSNCLQCHSTSWVLDQVPTGGLLLESSRAVVAP